MGFSVIPPFLRLAVAEASVVAGSLLRPQHLGAVLLYGGEGT